MRRTFLGCLSLSAVVVCNPSRVEAGAPLICHPIEIGDARSLPFGDSPFEIDESYDRGRVVADTLGLLQPGTPVLVRMETLRRAVMYVAADEQLAQRLLLELMTRVLDAGADDALAWFDAGYLVETYKQAGLHGGGVLKRFGSDWRQGSFERLDGKVWIEKALRLRGADPQMEFAAALATAGRQAAGGEHREHLRKAGAGAAQDGLLARNLESHFGGIAHGDGR